MCCIDPLPHSNCTHLFTVLPTSILGIYSAGPVIIHLSPGDLCTVLPNEREMNLGNLNTYTILHMTHIQSDRLQMKTSCYLKSTLAITVRCCLCYSVQSDSLLNEGLACSKLKGFSNDMHKPAIPLPTKNALSGRHEIARYN